MMDPHVLIKTHFCLEFEKVLQTKHDNPYFRSGMVFIYIACDIFSEAFLFDVSIFI